MKEIPLTRGKVAKVDDCDYARVASVSWSAKPSNDNPGKFYAAHRTNETTVYMHRLIMSAGPGQEVDHRDNDGLNNQQSNLRLCSHRQNEWSKGPNRTCVSGYKGVIREKLRSGRLGKWAAHIQINRKKICLGRFDTPEQAASAYDAKAKEVYGEFAYQNLPGNKVRTA